MAHGRGDHCGCFPTGVPYPGIAELLISAPAQTIGLTQEIDGITPFLDVPLAVIDTETTGKDPARGDRIVEVAVVWVDRGQVTGRHALLVDPCMPIPAEASAVHGIHDADVKGKPKWDGIAKQLVSLLAGRLPVAYNASFDRAFLYSEMRRVGTTPGPDRTLPPALRTTVEWLDPLVWARALQTNEKGFKLGAVAARLGIDLTNAHRATDDAEAAARVLLALLTNGQTPYREIVQKQREHQSAWEKTRGGWRR